jgi:hypothetical protein
MEKSARIFIALSIFLVLGAAIMGCSSNSSSTAKSSTVTTMTTIAPLYTAGDIVGSSSSPSSAWLIISYDSAKDTYTRAFIYKNTDGTWGYRLNSNSETYPRSTMEKVYKVKITHVTISSIPTSAPTTVVTTTVTTKATTVATAATTTTAAKPSFKDMDPDNGYAGNSVTSTITGGNFIATPKVMLTHSGSSSIMATGVTWTSATQITATFAIPNTTSAGIWSVVITNPDGQLVTYANEFTVHEETDNS